MPALIGAADSFIGSAASFIGLSTYDPLAIAWHSAFWAEDPDWSNPGDGNAVSSWRNAGSNGTAATQGTGSNQPTYRSSVAGLNNQPAVDADGLGDYLTTGAFGTALSQPNTIVVVSKADAADSAFHTMIDGTSQRQAVRIDSANQWEIFANGTPQDGGTANANGHIHVAYFSTTSSYLEVDGVQVAAGDPGTHNLDGITLFSSPGGGNYWAGELAFVGVYDGTLASSDIDDLVGWSRSHYGTP